MPRTRRHKADRGRCISRAARDKRDLGGDRCDTAPDARRQHMVLEDQQALSGLNHNLAHIESRPVTVFPAHSSDRWGKEASLAQLGAGFIQPFAGGTAMAGRAAKGSPLRGPGADAGHYPAGIAAGGRSPLRDGPADRPACEVQRPRGWVRTIRASRQDCT